MGCERESNCSGMFRTSSKLQRAQRVHVACRIRIHANEPATAWAETPTAIIIIIIIIEQYHCIICIEKTLGGLYIENGVLYDRQISWPCRSSVGVHFYAFHTFARETYDMWQPARWGGSLRTIVQWKCVSCPHWWYLFSAFVWRTILRKWLACSLETGVDLWLCFNIVPEANSEPRKSQCGHVPPTIFHTLICHVLCHEKIGIGICL